MKRVILAVLLSLYLVQTLSAATDEPGFWQRVRSSIEKNLGRPYVWGAAGLKSFDCSGFIWRVMYDNGILLKRTTARKFYMTLRPYRLRSNGISARWFFSMISNTWASSTTRRLSIMPRSPSAQIARR